MCTSIGHVWRATGKTQVDLGAGKLICHPHELCTSTKEIHEVFPLAGPLARPCPPPKWPPNPSTNSGRLPLYSRVHLPLRLTSGLDGPVVAKSPELREWAYAIWFWTIYVQMLTIMRQENEVLEGHTARIYGWSLGGLGFGISNIQESLTWLISPIQASASRATAGSSTSDCMVFSRVSLPSTLNDFRHGMGLLLLRKVWTAVYIYLR